jgi:hypothetical protein
MKYDQVVFSDHARIRMGRRDISEALVREALGRPESDRLVREGRRVLQAGALWGEPPRMYLIRVFVDVDRNPPEIVTAYLTRKFGKYEVSP